MINPWEQILFKLNTNYYLKHYLSVHAPCILNFYPDYLKLCKSTIVSVRFVGKIV